MKYELKSIGIWSFFKISFFINAVFGFIFGFFYAIFVGLIMAVASNIPFLQSEEFASEDMSIGLLMIVMPIVMAVFMAVFNTIVGSIILLIYNLFSKLLGGIEFNFEKEIDEPAAPIVATPQPSYAPPQQSPPPPPPPPPAPAPSEPIIQDQAEPKLPEQNNDDNDSKQNN